jgi:branched-chain amino acid transport system permease protein
VWQNIQLLIQVPWLNVQYILDGIFLGAVFALAAYGLALVWGVMNLKNLAQGDFVILGGYMAWFMQVQLGWNPILTIPIVMVIMFGFGWLMYLLVIRWVIDRDLFTSLLTTFGMALVLQQLLNLAFGPETQVAESHLGTIFILDGFVSLPEIRLIGVVICAIIAAAMIIYMKKSRMGQAIRATAQDPRAAKVMGINTDRIYAFTFSLNATICGAAGSLVAMMFVIQPFYGIAYSIRSFVIVTAAGLGNLPGVIASAFGLGILEGYANIILGASYQQFIVVFALIVVLVWRIFQYKKLRMAVE